MSHDPVRPKNKARHDSDAFRIGNRVGRKDGPEKGTVVAAGGNTKIKWDGGRTSYFRHGSDANVKLA